jgi:hypothetical protein
LNYEFFRCVQVSLEEYGSVRTWPLKPGGETTSVTNDNRREYVALYLDWVLNAAIYRQFRAFYLGFHSVCASNALIVSFNATLFTLEYNRPYSKVNKSTRVKVAVIFHFRINVIILSLLLQQ